MTQYNSILAYITITLFLYGHLIYAQDHVNAHNKKNKSEYHSDNSSRSSTADKTKDGVVYQCPMHLEVISNIPGRCSKCDMKLKEYTLEEALNNLSEKRKKKLDPKYKNIEASNVEKEKKTEGPKDETNHSPVQHTENHDECCNEYEIPNMAQIDLNRDGIVYQCPMCPDQLSDYPGNCPECGMKLEKYKVDEALKNME